MFLFVRFYHCVQIFFANEAVCLLVEVSDFDPDDFPAGLNSSSQLRVDTLTDEDGFDNGEVGQVGPTHGRENVEILFHEVGHVAKG